MKIKLNNICLFKKLEDIIPTIDIDINLLFNKNYIQDSNNNYVLSDNIKLVTYISNMDNLYNLLKVITEDRINELFYEYYSKSSQKTLSNLVNLMLLTYGLRKIDDYYTLSKIGIVNILNTIYYRYYRKWNKLYNTTLLEYDALRPYDMKVDSIIQNNMHTKSKDSSKNNYNGNSFQNNKSDSYNYGYDSPNEVPTGKTKGDIIENDNYSNNKDSVSEYDRVNPIITDISRKGNIGNITQQELLIKEREVLQYQIITTIFNDLDRVLTRSKYI